MSPRICDTVRSRPLGVSQEDLVAQGDAFGADVHVRPGDQPQALRTPLAAEGARRSRHLAAAASPPPRADIALKLLLDGRDADAEPEQEPARSRAGVEDQRR